MKPVWLEGKDGYSATVLGFVTFDLGTLAIAKLDQKLKSKRLESDIAILQLRYKNTTWNDEEHVHIFLGNGTPSSEFASKEWLSNNTVWVESHANYKKI